MQASVTRRFKVCLVGQGRMGKYRAAVIREDPRLDLAAVVDVRRDCPTATARTIAEAHSAAGPFDCIWISAPTKRHPALIAEAAALRRAPKVVFCEKPIAESADDVALAYAACERAGVRLICGWMRRLDAGYAAVGSAVLDRLKAGDPLSKVTMVSDDWPPVESRSFLASLGTIYEDLMCHDFNLAAYYTAEADPLWVEATGSSSKGDGLIDTAHCTVQFPAVDGVAGNGPVFEMVARRESQVATYENSVVAVTKSGRVYTAGQNLGAYTFLDRHDKSYRAEVAFVAECLGGSKREYPSTKRSCLLTARLISLAERSSKLGGKRLYFADGSNTGRPKL